MRESRGKRHWHSILFPSPYAIPPVRQDVENAAVHRVARITLRIHDPELVLRRAWLVRCEPDNPQYAALQGAAPDHTDGSALRINNATVIAADVGASNGVIHVIDQVLLPPESGASLDRMSERVATTSAPRELIAQAIRRGVPLYNDGQPEATSAIYEVTARAVVALGNEVPSRVRRRLEQGLRDAEREDALAERAWTLRRALDDAARGLAGREMTASRH